MVVDLLRLSWTDVVRPVAGASSFVTGERGAGPLAAFGSVTGDGGADARRRGGGLRV
jgi:hypothetical protein